MISITHTPKNIHITTLMKNMFSRQIFQSTVLTMRCQDCSCSYGCPVDIVEAARIFSYKEELERRLGISSCDWF
jgi:hypothetical protein